MEIMRVEQFLCLSLESGGLIIGWFMLVLNALVAVLSVVGLISMSILSCDDLKEIMQKNGDTFDAESCEVVKIVFIIVLLIATVICIVFAVVGWLCVSGTKQRNHNRIKPMVVILAVETILAFFNVFSFTASGIFSGLLFGSIYGYLFVCIYSLFYKIREEFERGLNPQFQGKA